MASCRASMTSSTCAISRLVSPAKPTSLAMNLQIAMDWKILSPVDQVRQGSWPHVMLGFRSSHGLESSQGRLILESSNWRPPYARRSLMGSPRSLWLKYWSLIPVTQSLNYEILPNIIFGIVWYLTSHTASLLELTELECSYHYQYRYHIKYRAGDLISKDLLPFHLLNQFYILMLTTAMTSTSHIHICHLSPISFFSQQRFRVLQ